MSWRQAELSAFGDELTWLGAAEAAEAYARAMTCCSRTHYGLDLAEVESVSRLCLEGNEPAAKAWLLDRVGDRGTVVIVFGESDVCRTRAAFFVENWQDLFGPCRDDVVILSEAGTWVCYYSHEDEFEYGRRRTS